MLPYIVSFPFWLGGAIMAASFCVVIPLRKPNETANDLLGQLVWTIVLWAALWLIAYSIIFVSAKGCG